MRDLEDIINIRNGVIHGIGWSNEGFTMAQTHRPDRSIKINRKKNPDHRPEQDPWVPVDYDRELLIGAGRRAMQISGFIQVRKTHWPSREEIAKQLTERPGFPSL